MTARAVPGAPLVVGVGNRLRGDDGVGWRVAECLIGDPRVAGAAVLTAHQLTPELAADIATSTVTVIVDADATCPPGVVTTRPVAAGRWEPLGHHLGPAALVGLAEGLYGPAPPVHVVGVGAATFDGEELSPAVAAAVARAADAVVSVLTEMTDRSVTSGPA